MINKELLHNMIEQGYVSMNKHPKFNLYIYNYTNKCQYEGMWNEVTLQTRGLILDAEYSVVARPFNKFFNLSEHRPEDIPNLPFEVFDKIDGSLGILYFGEDGKPYIATKGSFTSEQAIKANEILYSKYKDKLHNLDKEYTYLFEIVFPENRIVVDYKDFEDLVLLSIFHTRGGFELSYNEYAGFLQFPTTKRHNGVKDIFILKELEESNKEGFVVRFEDGFRVKVKFDEYIRLHKIVTMVTSKTIWEYLKDDKDFNEIIDRVPDEFFTWVKKIKEGLLGQFNDIKESTVEKYSTSPDFETQKEFALWAKEWNYPHLLFSLRNSKSIDHTIWKMIKPKFERPFSNEC